MTSKVSFLDVFKKSKDYKASLSKPPTKKEDVFKVFEKFINSQQKKKNPDVLQRNLDRMKRVFDVYKTKILPNQSLEEVRGFYDSVLETEKPSANAVLNNILNRIVDMGGESFLEELKAEMEAEKTSEDKPTTPSLRGAGAGAGAGAEPKEPQPKPKEPLPPIPEEPAEPKEPQPKPDEPQPKPDEPAEPLPAEPLPAEPKVAEEEEEEEEDKPEEKVEEKVEDKPKEVMTQQEPNKNIVSKIGDDNLVLDPNVNPPSKKLGKSLQDLSVEEINKDLDYFYKTFPDRLKKLKRTKSKNLRYLRRFYRRVLNLLRVEDKKGDKQIGIIIKGSDFIKDKLKEIIMENSINGLTAKDLLINIEGNGDKDKADAGKYEFKTNPTTGIKYAQGEPVDRLIPTQEEKRIEEVHSDHTASSYKKKPSRIPNPKTMYRGQEVTARKMVQANPFLTARQPTIKLKTIY